MKNTKQEFEKKQYQRVSPKTNTDQRAKVERQSAPVTEDSKTFRMNPLNYWAGPHFLFYIK